MKRIAQKDSKLSKEQVAALVKREVVEGEKTKLVAISADEVMGWAEYHAETELEASRVVVVTTDGQRFTGSLPSGKK